MPWLAPGFAPPATGSLRIFSFLGDHRRDITRGMGECPSYSPGLSRCPEAPERATQGVGGGGLLNQLGIHPGKPAPHYRRQHGAIPWPGSDSG